MALGLLADRYSKYTNNKKFKKQVESVRRARNKLAHAMFIKAEHLADDFGETLDSEIDDVYHASELAAALGDMVMEETQHIYFDPYKEKWIKA